MFAKHTRKKNATFRDSQRTPVCFILPLGWLAEFLWFGPPSFLIISGIFSKSLLNKSPGLLFEGRTAADCQAMHTNIASQKLSCVYRVYKLMEHVIVISIRQFLSHTRVSAMLAELSVCHPEHHTSHVFGIEETITYIRNRIGFWCLWTLLNVDSNNWDGPAGSCSACSELRGSWCLSSHLSPLSSWFCSWILQLRVLGPFLPLSLANPACAQHVW